MSLKDRYVNARNFVAYYGSGREDEMSGFDIAIVEPAGHDKASIKKMQQNGAIVLAYTSVVEISPDMPDFKLLKDEDFLKSESGFVKNERFGTFMADIRSPRWNNLLIHRAGRLLVQQGYDGLFIDTMGNVELGVFTKDLQDQLISAVVSLLQRLRNTFGDKLLIQNNGLERLCLYTSSLIDGICWENPPFDKKESMLWWQEIVDRLEIMGRNDSVRTLLLIEDKCESGRVVSGRESELHKMARKIAKAKGFLLYRAPEHYIGAVNRPVEE